MVCLFSFFMILYQLPSLYRMKWGVKILTLVWKKVMIASFLIYCVCEWGIYIYVLWDCRMELHYGLMIWCMLMEHAASLIAHKAQHTVCKG
jgi:hypothetical protein